jgi:hypothetical protein
MGGTAGVGTGCLQAQGPRALDLLECAAAARTAQTCGTKPPFSTIGTVTLAEHEDGSPVAIAIMDQKEGTQRYEQSAAVLLLESLPALDGKVVTADALHCQKLTACTIVEITQPRNEQRPILTARSRRGQRSLSIAKERCTVGQKLSIN